MISFRWLTASLTYGERFCNCLRMNRARAKAYVRLLPLLFLSYAIAYVDRINVSLAKLEDVQGPAGF